MIVVHPYEREDSKDPDNIDLRSILNALKTTLIMDDSLDNIALAICKKNGERRETVAYVVKGNLVIDSLAEQCLKATQIPQN